MTRSAAGDHELDQRLDAVLIGGREDVDVRLAAYSETGPARACRTLGHEPLRQGQELRGRIMERAQREEAGPARDEGDG
jgi:hypothetical protein